MSVPEIKAEELKRRLDAGENLFLLDVRSENEYETSNIGGHLIPLPELPERVHELDANRKIVVVCKMGPRGSQGSAGSAYGRLYQGLESFRRDSRLVRPRRRRNTAFG
jgi:rhodanese-related sulfurtransferase